MQLAPKSLKFPFTPGLWWPKLRKIWRPKGQTSWWRCNEFSREKPRPKTLTRLVTLVLFMHLLEASFAHHTIWWPDDRKTVEVFVENTKKDMGFHTTGDVIFFLKWDCRIAYSILWKRIFNQIFFDPWMLIIKQFPSVLSSPLIETSIKIFLDYHVFQHVFVQGSLDYLFFVWWIKQCKCIGLFEGFHSQ